MTIAATYVPPSRLWIRNKLGWEPNSPDQAAFVDSPFPRNQGTGGEQSGKSDGAAEIAAERTFEFNHPIIGWFVGNTYRASRKEYDYLWPKFSALGVYSDHSRSSADRQRQIKLVDGSTFTTLSAGDTENIGQEAPDIIIACEAGQLTLEAFYKLRLRQGASGGLLVMTGTPERSQPWWNDLYRQWQVPGADGRSFSLDARKNPYRYPGGLENAEVQQMMKVLPPDVIAERMAGIPREPEGLVFAGYFKSEFHVRNKGYIKGLPVSLAIDPGYSQSVHSVLAIQCPPDEPIRTIDEVYTRSPSPQVVRMCQAREWWADVQDGVIDIAATFKSEKRPIDVWAENARLNLLSKKVAIADGIQRAQDMFLPDPITMGPQATIAPWCTGFLSELGMLNSPLTDKFEAYRWVLTKDASYKSKVPKDEHCHSIKAWWYWLTVKFGTVHRTHQNVAKVTYH